MEGGAPGGGRWGWLGDFLRRGLELGLEGSDGPEGWKASLASGPEGLQAPRGNHPQLTRPASHLLVGRGRKHLLLLGMLGEVEGIGHHQVTPVEAGREHEGDGPHPLHYCLCLGGHLPRGAGRRQSSRPGASPPITQPHARALGFHLGPTPPGAPQVPILGLELSSPTS